VKRVHLDPTRAVVAGPNQRRGRVMGIVPNDDVNIRLLGAMLLVQHERGLLKGRRMVSAAIRSLIQDLEELPAMNSANSGERKDADPKQYRPPCP
jgi:hypothetical protein